MLLEEFRWVLSVVWIKVVLAKKGGIERFSGCFGGRVDSIWYGEGWKRRYKVSF